MDNKEENIFGTDGIRGTPGAYPLSDGMIFKIGSSVAKLLFHRGEKDASYKVIIGRDTRLSGDRLEVILSNAISSHGVDVLLAGTIPTPGLSYLVKEAKASMGIMISASHNKTSDNGIKFFTENGRKLSIEEEVWMEQLILGSLIHISNGTVYRKKGKIETYNQAASAYIGFLASTAADIDLGGFKAILDCAWGATSTIAETLFRRLGINAQAIHDIPKEEGINHGGAMYPQLLRSCVLEQKADAGFAFDGDGDRVILVDEKGNLLDGDHIMAIIGIYLLETGKLSDKKLVATLMSNWGLEQAIKGHGGELIITKVGDKHIFEILEANNLNLGGEQSGHIILSDYAPTPDGLLTALQILKIMKAAKKSLSELASVMHKLPQVLVNVKVKEKKPLHTMPVIQEAIAESKRKLGDCGRVFVRYSGTEQLARIMVEGPDQSLVQDIARFLEDTFEKELGVEKLQPYAQN